MIQRVVVTGMGGVTAFGESWAEVSARIRAGRNAVRFMPEWQIYDGLHTLLGAPVDDFVLPAHYTPQAHPRHGPRFAAGNARDRAGADPGGP
ncbi:3-oxoacyl-(acyl carrier protein) synthase II [Pantoea agglomerans]|uniref:3-oxoacyl-(Acyl carrier protein) synthase II n=1 Tax=Enterobacter agglomerans TaxID=549 RepID=A0A379AHQ3_ENTAG|nr:3-oxoacyl-(acyl carrier protein) synthase II [Pantoea agglomerans]